MADEARLQARLTVALGNLRYDSTSLTIDMDVPSNKAAMNVQRVGTTAEAVILGDVTDCGVAYFRNLEATNFVEIGTGTGGSFVAFARLNAGEAAFVPLSTDAPTARFDTAEGSLQYAIFSRS